MKRTYLALCMSLCLIASTGFSKDPVISSMQDSIDARDARVQTFNESYPGGSSSTGLPAPLTSKKETDRDTIIIASTVGVAGTAIIIGLLLWAFKYRKDKVCPCQSIPTQGSGVSMAQSKV